MDDNADWSTAYRPVPHLVRKIRVGLARPVQGMWTHFNGPPHIRGSLHKENFFFKKRKLLIIKIHISSIEKLKFYPCFNSFN